jgi:uncharacterized protein
VTSLQIVISIQSSDIAPTNMIGTARGEWFPGAWAVQKIFKSIYWHPILAKAALAMVCLAGAIWLVFEYLTPAPPSTITIATGFRGGAYEYFGQQYRERLARAGITLVVRPTDGTGENLKLLSDPKSGVDIALVQSGVSNSRQSPGLLSLGRVSYQALWLFYRGTEALDNPRLLKGKRIAIGPVGSGTRVIALQVLGASGVNEKTATLLPIAGAAAVEALNTGKLDAIFVANPPESPTVQALLRHSEVRLMNITRAEALTRIYPHLVRLVLPQGVVDLENDNPPNDVNVIAATNSLLTRADMHPEMIQLLARTLQEVHSQADIFQRGGEFPTQIDQEYVMSDVARDFYRNGPTYLNRYLPFWLVDFIKKIVAVLVTFTVIFVPLMRMLPRVITWLVRDRIFHLYRLLRTIETQLKAGLAASEIAGLQADLEKIDRAADALGVPLRYSDLLFSLKSHINLVRERLALLRGSLA